MLKIQLCCARQFNGRSFENGVAGIGHPSCKIRAQYLLISKFRRVPYVVFFWVILRSLNFTCRRFGRLCSVFIGKLPTCLSSWKGQKFPKRLHIKFRRRAFTQKKTYNSPLFACSSEEDRRNVH
jgi:hypothetical protein